MVRVRDLVVISLCVTLIVVTGCERSEVAQAVSASGYDAPREIERVTRDVVYQPPGQAEGEEDSMLPEAVRGFWGKGKPNPGIDGEDTMKWANETFEALKNKGLTTANDAGSWLTQDFKNMNAWEYKVVFVADKQPAAAEKTLNQLGAQRWECFHVQPHAASLMFYFKKPKRSYLKSLPTSDLMRLVPMMKGE